MATKPFTVDGNIVVDEATLSNSTSSIVLPAGSTITGGGAVLDATNSDTDDLSEGTTNLYFTDARADARIALQAGANLDLSSKSTTDLSEGTNLYYTDTRARAAVSATTGSAGYDSVTGTFSIPANTTQVTEGTNLYYTDTRADARIALQAGANLDLSSKSTTDLSEGTNLYYTDTRADTRADARIALQAGANLDLSSKSTTDLSEGTNLYYTDVRADARIALQAGANLDLSSKSTTDLAEGTNLYYTDTRADARIAAASITDLSDADQSVQTTDNVTFANITATGYIAGPATFTIDPAAVGDNTGTVVIAGDLQVDGTTTTINSTTLEVEDKNVVLGPNAANDAANNGAGLTVTQPDTSNASLIYNTTDTQWELNKKLDIAGKVTSTDIDILSNNPRIRLDDSDTDNNAEVTLDNTSLRIEVDEDNAIADSLIKFRVDADTKAVITSDGRLGIGYDSPTDNIHILGSNASPNVGITLQSDDTANATATLTLMARDASNVNQPVNIQNQAGRLNIDANMDVIGVGTNFKSASYNILNLQTDTDDNGSSDDGIFKITNGSAGTTKAEFRWDESEDLVHVSYGDHGRHISINSAGNVGINTGSTAPTQPLDVAGTAKADQYLLDAVAKDISDTAVDVFIYDTRKDSDGGAWRKRTQGTSWYNETLNTATRGSRKEFPAVAVIVAEDDSVTIYDGDDPSLPMWMVFNNGGGSVSVMLAYDDGNSSVSMLNGTLVVGHDVTNNGISKINFITEVAFRHRDGSTSYTCNHNGIVERNANVGVTLTSDGALVNDIVNDVAMTVLPNAPIDAATGLPVPTIAVATNTGLSVITDSGQVFDKTTTSGNIYSRLYKIAFLENNDLCYYHDRGYNKRNVLAVYPVSRYTTQDYSSFDQGGNRIWGSYPVGYPAGIGTNANSSDSFSTITAHGNEIAAGKGIGLSVFDVQDTEDQSAVSYITSSYNTGWMNGDIKLATLSDTDDTDVTGSELVTNGTFDTDTDWTKQSGWSISGGVASNSGTSGYLYQTSGIPPNTRVTFTFDITSYTSGSVRPGSTGYGTNPFFSSAGTHSVTYTTSGTDPAGVELLSSSFVGSVDNVSVRLAEEDRSVNGNGLQVVGTVTKNPVATGADLVAYSGFSSSNYLRQPYNSDLDFGTGDFCFNMWFNSPNTSVFGTLLHRSATNSGDGVWTGSGNIIQIEFNQTNLRLGVWTNGFGGGSTGIIDLDDGSFPSNKWIMLTFLRRNGVLEAYQDGRFRASQNGATAAIDVSNTSANLWIGNRPNVGDRPFNGSFALYRASATALSAKQIKKIYEDEKVLFQENAKATLYGSSNAVTALAYDDDTELLHVGTSAGRSVFQGLRRIDNTTDAVGAAISASNGMVAED